MSKPKRVMINTLQKHDDLHKYHGKKAIAVPNGVFTSTVYFTEGDLRSMIIPNNKLVEI